MDTWCFSVKCDEGWLAFYSDELDAQTAKDLKLIVDDVLGEMGWDIRVENLQELKASNPARYVRIVRSLEQWKSILGSIDAGLPSESVDVNKCLQAYNVCVESLQYLRSEPAILSDNSTLKLKRTVNERLEPSSTGIHRDHFDRDGPTADRWFDSPPNSEHATRYRFGPISGQLKQLAVWIQQDHRTLGKYNGESFYYIQRVHSRLYDVWIDSETRYERVLRKQKIEIDEDQP